MPTSAELRQMRRIERWAGIIVPRVARRLVNGKPPQPGWLPRRWLTVVSGDVNPGGGIGAVWLVWRPRSAKAETHTALMERCGGQWQYMGGGSASGGDVAAERSAAGQPGQIGMIEVGGGAGCLSYAYRLQHPHSITAAPWVGSSELRVAADVGHLLFGGRRIEVPGHGRLIVAWKSRSTGSGGLRPLIVAVGRDGSELSRIGSHDSMDSYTWAKVSGQQELKLRTAGKHLRWPGPAGSNVPRRVQRVPPRTRSRPEALTIRRPPWSATLHLSSYTPVHQNPYADTGRAAWVTGGATGMSRVPGRGEPGWPRHAASTAATQILIIWAGGEGSIGGAYDTAS